MTIDLDRAVPPPRPRPRPRLRVPALVLTGSLLLAVLGAAAAPSRSVVLRPWTVTGARAVAWLLTGDGVYSVHSRAGDTVVEVRAYSLPGQDVLWSVPIEGQGFTPQLYEIGSAVVVVLGGAWMSVLDARTGRERWNDTRYQEAYLAGGRILAWNPGRLHMIDPESGTELWSQPAPDRPAAATAGHEQVATGEVRSVEEPGSILAGDLVRRCGGHRVAGAVRGSSAW